MTISRFSSVFYPEPKTCGEILHNFIEGLYYVPHLQKIYKVTHSAKGEAALDTTPPAIKEYLLTMAKIGALIGLGILTGPKTVVRVIASAVLLIVVDKLFYRFVSAHNTNNNTSKNEGENNKSLNKEDNKKSNKQLENEQKSKIAAYFGEHPMTGEKTCDIRLNPEDLPEEKELTDVLNSGASIYRMYVVIPSNKDQLQKMIDLLSKFNQEKYKHVKLNLEGTEFKITQHCAYCESSSAWGYSRGANEQITLDKGYWVHNIALTRFSALDKLQSNISSSDKGALIRFSYTGECFLNQASLCLPLLLQHRPLKYGYFKVSEMDTKKEEIEKQQTVEGWDSEIHWKSGDQSGRFYIHRSLVSRYERLDDLLKKREGYSLKYLTLGEEDISLSNLTEMIGCFYGDKVDLEKKSVNDLIQISSLATLWGLGGYGYGANQGLASQAKSVLWKAIKSDEFDKDKTMTEEEYQDLFKFAYSINDNSLMLIALDKASHFKTPMEHLLDLGEDEKEKEDILNWFLTDIGMNVGSAKVGLCCFMRYSFQKNFVGLSQKLKIAMYRFFAEECTKFKKEYNDYQREKNTYFIRDFRDFHELINGESNFWECLESDEDNNDENVIALKDLKKDLPKTLE